MENHSQIEPESCRFFSQFDANGYYKTDAVYLNAGGPGTELLRMLPPIIEAATMHQMQLEMEGDAQLFQYGLENGNWQFRSFLATFLSEEYGDPVNSQNLFLTGGASSGLWLLTSCLFKQGSVIFAEDPTYFCALKIFNDLGMTVIPVKTDDQGVVIDDLQEKFEQHLKIASHEELPLQALFYCIPVFHNPTGYVLSETRCHQLLKLAQKFGVTVVCDDVYNLLHYDESLFCPKRLFQFDKQYTNYKGNVISNCTFSKVLAPGLRIGWLEAPTWVIEKVKDFGVLHSGGGLNTYTSGVITGLLALGKLKTHLQKVRNIYQTNMKSTAQLLREELPPGCKLKSPAQGGYFLWIELPENIAATKLLPFAKKEYQIAFMPGQRASLSNTFENYLRICISFYPLDILLSAVRRLCEAVSDFQQKLEENPDFWEEYEHKELMI